MTRDHIEYPDDTTEREVGIVLGWVEPHEQTGSDAETEPLAPAVHIPVAKRWHRWRMYRDDYGRWAARQPEQLDTPMFRRGRYGFTHHNRERVLHELQLAVAIAKSYE